MQEPERLGAASGRQGGRGRDPRADRLPGGEEPAESLVVSYNYGFSADIGGGPYDRRERMTEPKLPIQEFRGRRRQDLRHPGGRPE